MNTVSGMISRFRATPIHVHLRWVRWMLPVVVLVMAGIHQMGLHYLVSFLPAVLHPEAELLIYGLTGSVVAWFGLSRIADSVAAQEQAENQLRTAYARLEASHSQLLTLQDFGRQISAAGNEQAVLELAAQAPLRLTEARGTTIITFDEQREHLKLDLAWGLSDTYLGALRSRMEMGIPMGRCLTCGTLKTDASSDCPLFEGMQQAARAEGIGGLLCLPINREQVRVGIISAYFPSADGPPEDQVRLLNILSGHIGAMLDNLRTRSRQVHTLYALDRASQTTNYGIQALREFADQVLKITTTGWDAQAGGLFLFDRQTQSWSCSARSGLGDDMLDARFSFALDYVHRAQTTGSLVISSELAPADSAGFFSAAVAPLMTEGQVLGAIFLGATRKRAFTNRHVDFLTTMSHQIALTVWNTQLYNQLDQMAVLKERFRLSREIHDGLAQTLGYLNLQTDRLAGLVGTGRTADAILEIELMRQSLQAAYVESREAIEGLRLEIERPDEMVARLREVVGQFQRQSGIQAQLSVDPLEISVPPAIALQLLRIVQEALGNVRKHSKASRVDVHLKLTGKEMEISVADDGQGFPEVMLPDLTRQHFGLATMRERAASVGGALSVATGPGQGTRVTVAVPLATQPDNLMV